MVIIFGALVRFRNPFFLHFGFRFGEHSADAENKMKIAPTIWRRLCKTIFVDELTKKQTAILQVIFRKKAN